MRDQRCRLNNLYWIKDAQGRRIRFRMNRAQEILFEQMHQLNIVLKARQLGFTTFIQLYLLDCCLFNSNVAAGTIAHRLEDAEEIFNNKIRYAYDNLPAGLKAGVGAEQDSARKLSFTNGSLIRVGTSLRSGTFQYLHISEFGKVCAQFPERAREIVTGALNTIHAGQVAFIESTAEGREGPFFDLCQTARNMRREGRPLTALDWRFFFYPWFRHPGYVLDPAGVIITAEEAGYFDQIERGEGVTLSPEQRAWYAKKKVSQGEDMKREFPSTPDEAFEASIQGAYYASEMARLRENKQITRVPHEPGVEVNSFWDLGIDDQTAIWFHQRIGRENRLIDYYENSGEGFAHYAKVLKDKPYVYGTHYLPHDIEHAEISTGQVRKNTLLGLGVKPIKTVRRAVDVADDIQATRNFLLSRPCRSTGRSQPGPKAARRP